MFFIHLVKKLIQAFPSQDVQFLYFVRRLFAANIAVYQGLAESLHQVLPLLLALLDPNTLHPHHKFEDACLKLVHAFESVHILQNKNKLFNLIAKFFFYETCKGGPGVLRIQVFLQNIYAFVLVAVVGHRNKLVQVF